MPSVLTDFARVSSARDFINSLNTTPYYLGIGNVLPWDDDNNPPAPTKTIQNVYDVWRNSYALKRIKTIDAIHAVAKIEWTTGTVYDQYHDNLDMSGLQYYVLTSSNDVFKCLSNNNGSVSTEEPTIINTNTSDGYKWRWLYNIPTQTFNKFSTSTHIPVLDITSTPVEGEITRVDIINGGSGYAYASVNIVGNGTGAVAAVTLSGGSISSVVITNQGSGYTYAEAVITGDGIDGDLRVVLSPPGGHGYSIPDELLATTVIMSVDFDFDESGKVLTNNEFRSVFLVKQPLTYDGLSVYNSSIADTTTKIELNDVTTFNDDQIIELWLNSSTVGTATVAYKDTINNTLYLNGITSSNITSVHKLYDGFNQFDIVNISNSDVKLFSGKVIYILNRQPISRDILQTETIKLGIVW